MYSPKEIAERYVAVGTGKAELPASSMLILGIFAGAFIAFGALASQIIAVSIPLPSVAKCAGAAVFPIGLMLVLCAGGELFTGNCLMIIPLLEKKITAGGMLKNWVLVYAGNFIGSILVAMAAAYGHVYSLFDGKTAEAVVSTSLSKTALSFPDALIRGILCNIMVCLAVWVSFAAKELAVKIIGLMLPIFLFVLCGFEHSVANMYFVPAGFFASAQYGIPAEGLSAGAFLLRNLLPVTIGNIIGGSLIVGAGYWFVYLRERKNG